MTEITHSDDVMSKMRELDNYVSQSLDILKSLRIAKEDADMILRSLSQRKDELSGREKDLSEYLMKLQVVSQKADALLSPILQEKQELENLNNKITEGLAAIGTEMQKQTDVVSAKLAEKQKALETEIGSSVATLRKEFQAAVADVLRKNNEALKTLSQRIESQQNVVNVQKTGLEGQSKKVEQLGNVELELHEAVKDLKGVVEKHHQEFNAALTELREKQKQEFGSALAELREKHINILEKDSAHIKSALNGIITKLSNVKFKKMLGL